MIRFTILLFYKSFLPFGKLSVDRDFHDKRCSWISGKPNFFKWLNIRYESVLHIHCCRHEKHSSSKQSKAEKSKKRWTCANFRRFFLRQKDTRAYFYAFLHIWYSVKLGQNFRAFRQTPTDLKILGWEYLWSPVGHLHYHCCLLLILSKSERGPQESCSLEVFS